LVPGAGPIKIHCRREVHAKKVAIPPRIAVVARGRAHGVRPAGGRLKRLAADVERHNRDDSEEVELACWQSIQRNVQPADQDLVFEETEPAPAGRSNGCGVCAADDHRAAVPFGDASADFPLRGGNCGIQASGQKSIAEETCHSPLATGRPGEIVIDTAKLARAELTLKLVSAAVASIKVPVIPKGGVQGLQWVFLDLDRLVSRHGRLTCGREIGEPRPARGWTQPPHPPGGALLGVSLRQREWDHADGQQQKHVKCTSNKMSFDGGIDLFFHVGIVLV